MSVSGNDHNQRKCTRFPEFISWIRLFPFISLLYSKALITLLKLFNQIPWANCMIDWNL